MRDSDVNHYTMRDLFDGSNLALKYYIVLLIILPKYDDESQDLTVGLVSVTKQRHHIDFEGRGSMQVSLYFLRV